MIGAAVAVFCTVASPVQCDEIALPVEVGAACIVSPAAVVDYMRQHGMVDRYTLKSWRCDPRGRRNT